MRQHLLSIIYYPLSIICRAAPQPPCGKRSRAAFTLIEMIVVLLIIAILMAATITGLSRARNNAWRMQARETCREISEAWNAYLLDMREFPSMSEGAATTHDNLKEIIGEGETKTVYLELKKKEKESGDDGGLRDHWGDLYHFTLDTGYEGEVKNPYPEANSLPSGTKVKATSIVWSFGGLPEDDARYNNKRIVVW